MAAQQRAWIINHYAVDELKGTELELVQRDMPEPDEGEVLVKTLLLTLDPSNRLWLSEQEDYLPQLQIGDVMRGFVLGRVEQSRHPGFAEGDYLFATLGWEEYAVVHGDQLTPENGAVRFTPNPDIPLDAYVSALGGTGWTAYVGMKYTGGVKAGDRVLVSGAAGATGLSACQIAQAEGASVVGIAGGENKCRLLVDEFGLAGAIDYKAVEDLSAAMKAQFPEGIDLFFDNVGGAMLDAALENMAIGGRIVISGSISQYQKFGDKEQLYGVKNTFMLAGKRLRMEGFLILDYMDQLTDILGPLETLFLNDQLHYGNSRVDGIENAQAALPRLFSGQHDGKLVVYFE